MIKTLSQSQYDSFKKSVVDGIQRQQHASVLLSEIELISPEKIKVRGIPFFMDKDAFKSLVKSMGVSVQMINKINLEGQALGEFVSNLRNLLKKKRNDDGRVFMYAINDGGVGRATSFSKGMNASIEDTLFFDMVERVANKGMDISYASFDGDNIVVNLTNPKSQVDLGGDESFVRAINLISSPYRHISLGDGNMRLICTNGMITGTMTRLTSTDSKSVKEFLTKVESVSNRWIDQKNLLKKITHARNVNASYEELYKAVEIASQGSMNENDKMRAGILNDIFKIADVREKYAKNSIEIKMRPEVYRRTAATPVNMWNLINEMTWLATHESELELTVKSKMQLAELAGEYMAKGEYDLETIAPKIVF